MRFCLSFLVFMSLLISCNSPTEVLKEAKRAISEKRYSEAIRLIDKAILKKNNFTEAYLEKAYCYSQLNLDDSAIIVYQKVVAFSLKNTLAFYNIGLCKYRKKDFGGAISSFKNALRTKDFDPDDSLKKGFYFEYTPGGKEVLGIDDRFDVPFSDIMYMLGLSEYNAGDIQSSFLHFQNCINRKAFLQEIYYMIGLCWLSAGEKQKACESLRSSNLFNYQPAVYELERSCK